MSTQPNLLGALNWRAAVKTYDKNKKLREPDIMPLLETLRLAPSAYGLQPYHFFMIENEALREKLRAVSFNQPQVTEASHFIVLAARTKIDDALVDDYVKLVATERDVAVGDLAGFREAIRGFLSSKTDEERAAWAKNQAYLALGFLLTACAIEEIDATPMEGFVPADYDKILGLKSKNLTAVLVVALGYRATDDKISAMKKVRQPFDEIFTELK